MRVLCIFKNKIFLCILLFLIVLIVFALAGRNVWFSSDDLGNIINGLIRSWSDFIRVFSEDERVYIYPINFTIPKPNVVSGFYRPLQHIPFTIIYYFFNFNPYAYYLASVFFHALNTTLFCYLLSFYIPISLSLCAGFVYAFALNFSWITWISCLHNFMALFFMLLTLIFYRQFWVSKKWHWHALAGFMFLLSIISRENTIFLGVCIFIAVLFLQHDGVNGLWNKIKFLVSQTWIFFASYLVYFLLRLHAFGFSSLQRTLNTIVFKFPVLKNIFAYFIQPQGAVVNVPTVPTAVAGATDVIFNASVSSSQVPERVFCLSCFAKKIQHSLDIFNTWGSSLLNINLGNKIIYILVLSILILTVFAYRRHKLVLSVLGFSFLIFLWPGIVAYPNPRYISAAGPILIAIVFWGLHFFLREIKRPVFIYLFFLSIVLGSAFYTFTGMCKNIQEIKNNCADSQIIKNRFTSFFEENKFESDANFVVMGSPFVSDIQNIFQMFLNNFNTKLALVRESTLASFGIMGCSGDYRIVGVPSKLEPIAYDGKRAFRFISLDKNQCCWWMNFSGFPLQWSQQDRAYVLSPEPIQVGKLYDFSMGKFIINAREGEHFVTDVTFVFDDGWIDEKTVFVLWDSMLGKYKALH